MMHIRSAADGARLAQLRRARMAGYLKRQAERRSQDTQAPKDRNAIEAQIALSGLRRAVNLWIEGGSFAALVSAEWHGARWRHFSGLENCAGFTIRDAIAAARARIHSGPCIPENLAVVGL